MAMYEDLGFCPANSFGYNYPEATDESALWARTKEILSDRIGFMVYDHNACAWGRKICSVVDVFRFGGESTLGLEIACALQHYIPICSYSATGKKILIKDVINPNQAPLQVTDRDGNGVLMPYADADLAKVRIFQDERYFVELTDVDGEVHLYIYKK